MTAKIKASQKLAPLDIPMNMARGTQISSPKIESKRKAADEGSFL